MEIALVRGDITLEHVDAIVNAANSTLLGGGGVDGAIHRAGGRQILNECQRLRRDQYVDGLPAGEAVATTAGNLAARYVIHTVGPVWSATNDRSATLRACYRNSLRVADEIGAHSIAFPAISTGVYRWPLDDGARIALAALSETDSKVEKVRFVLFSDRAFAAFHHAKTRLSDT